VMGSPTAELALPLQPHIHLYTEHPETMASTSSLSKIKDM
jgi:hypothetical protein